MGNLVRLFFFPLDNLAKEEDELHKNGYFLAGVFPWNVYGYSPTDFTTRRRVKERDLKKKEYKQGSQVHKMFIHEEGKDPIPMTLTIVRIISVGWVEI